MPRDQGTVLEQKLDDAIGLLKHLLAIELAREGVPRQMIAKHLGVANAKVGAMLKGVKKNGE